jgi:transcriptional regulator with XRE-family HTH domain
MDQSRAFGRLLRDLREEAEYRLTTLALDLRVSPTYLSDVELGRRPPLIPERIAEAGNLMKLPREQIEALQVAAGVSRGGFSLVARSVEANQVAALLAGIWSRLEDEDYLKLLNCVRGLEIDILVRSSEGT